MTSRGFDIEEYLVLIEVKLKILPFPKEEQNMTAKGLVETRCITFFLSLN